MKRTPQVVLRMNDYMLSDIVVVTMAKLAFDEALGPVIVRAGTQLTVPTVEEIAWVRAYVRNLRIKARSLGLWVRLAKDRRREKS